MNYDVIGGWHQTLQLTDDRFQSFITFIGQLFTLVLMAEPSTLQKVINNVTYVLCCLPTVSQGQVSLVTCS